MNLEQYNISCRFCDKPVKFLLDYIKFTCMCDDEIRIIYKKEIQHPEYFWRFSFKDIVPNEMLISNEK